MPETPDNAEFQQPPGPGLGVVCETRSYETQWSGVAPGQPIRFLSGHFSKGFMGAIVSVLAHRKCPFCSAWRAANFVFIHHLNDSFSALMERYQPASRD
jgi:hypothetical protein